jgi:dTDP-4-dehydrorhamnose reductase
LKILVAGAGGKLGRALTAGLAAHTVVPLERGQLDIADAGAVRDAVRAHSPDLVVNAAAYNEVDRAETERETAWRANVRGPENLARATADAGAAVLHVSSDYVFDGRAGRPYHEDDAPHPLSVYGESKLAGEEAVRRSNPRHYVVRTAWLFAADGRNFALTMLDLAARGPVRVVRDLHGSPTYVPHLAEAIGRLLATGAYGTWHLAGRGTATWFELADAIFRRCGIAAALEPVTAAEVARPAARPAFSALTTVREPAVLLPPWEEGVAAFARQREEARRPAR